MSGLRLCNQHGRSPKPNRLQGGNMAGQEFSSPALYRLVVLLNGTLQFLISRLEELAATKVLTPEYLKEVRRLTDKIESELRPK